MEEPFQPYSDVEGFLIIFEPNEMKGIVRTFPDIYT